MKFVIPHQLTTLNEYVDGERRNRYIGAKIKKEQTDLCALYARMARNNGVEVKDYPIHVKFTWYCKDARKDPDNVAFAKKFIFDGMVKAGMIDNDNWKHTHGGFTDKFVVDKQFQGVVIEIKNLSEVQSDDDVKRGRSDNLEQVRTWSE